MENVLMNIEDFKDQVLQDYKIAILSRTVSELARQEVMQGRANFAITGRGKEIPLLVLAKFFEKGDFYSGYYRDQTFILAKDIYSPQEMFAQLYGNPIKGKDHSSRGRQMTNHFATDFVDEQGDFLNLAQLYNIPSFTSCLATQAPRTLGLAQASLLYRKYPHLDANMQMSNNGNEVAFCTIGDASTSEGIFWETVNAAAVLQIPLAMFVWDDGFGISVPREYQTAQGSISVALSGMAKTNVGNGKRIKIYEVNGWDYAALHKVFGEGIQEARENHVPVLFHVKELTQLLGHSTSGSHQRYKTPQRLEWEKKWDSIVQFKSWILEKKITDEATLETIDQEIRKQVQEAKNKAYNEYIQPIKEKVKATIEVLEKIETSEFQHKKWVQPYIDSLQNIESPKYASCADALYSLINKAPQALVSDKGLKSFLAEMEEDMNDKYHTHLYNENDKSTFRVNGNAPTYDKEPQMVNGYEVLNIYFHQLFEKNPLVLGFGQDVGKIGDVNQGFAGLQQKYGEDRIFDTGIREATIIGQAIGLAMRGLRPIAEIQYLDYIYYAYQQLCDEVSTLHYRTAGTQICPLIVRTRGHRLDGIWHAGSPMGTLINGLRGMIVAVPRNMTQAAGMYNTFLEGNDPALIIESLNGYRLKEALPNNLMEMKIPMGMPEILMTGSEITLVSYGSTLRIVMQAAERLKAEHKIKCEVIDVQTLLPFDKYGIILKSLKKTNRIIFIDEDVSCATTAYMLTEVIDKQGGFQYLDAKPRTLSAFDHRTPYGSDGDYFTKPQEEHIITIVKDLMKE